MKSRSYCGDAIVESCGLSPTGVLHGMDLIGSTALAFLERYSRKLAAGGNKLMLYGVERRALKSLESAGTIKIIGGENVFPNTSVLGESFEKALAAANEWIKENKR